MAGLVVMACAGCSAMSTSDAGTVAKSRSHTAASVAQVSSALVSCGLATPTPGVTLGTTKLVRLTSQIDGQPSGVDRVSLSCTLDALGLPQNDRNLLQSTSITGGYQTVTWGDYSATWRFVDTLTFDVTVYAAS